MEDEEKIRTDIEFAVADAQWRYILREEHGETAAEDRFMAPELRGEPGSVLRGAHEERRRALEAWRRARGTT